MSVQESGETAADGTETERTSSGRGLSVPYLDDAVAVLVILLHFVIVFQVMAGAWQWRDLPEPLQYWTNTAFILALGLIFGKGALKFRRDR